jgi:predicted Fe-S protein YdhL (DUF1289 family)
LLQSQNDRLREALKQKSEQLETKEEKMKTTSQLMMRKRTCNGCSNKNTRIAEFEDLLEDEKDKVAELLDEGEELPHDRPEIVSDEDEDEEDMEMSA